MLEYVGQVSKETTVTSTQINDARNVGDAGAPGSLTWFGHASVLLTTRSGTRVIFDPWLENPKSPITLEQLGPVDFIAATHAHSDHIGSVIPLAEATGATIVCVPELRAYFNSQGVTNIIEMNKGGTIRVKDVTLTMVMAEHSCGLDVGENLPYAYGGNPVGFIVGLPEGDGGPVYISGDTNVFGDMALIADLYAPEIAMIPIDGYYNMGPREAAHAVGLLRVGRVAPYHYGTFPILTGTPEQLRQHLDLNYSSATVVALEPGQSVPLTP